MAREFREPEGLALRQRTAGDEHVEAFTAFNQLITDSPEQLALTASVLDMAYTAVAATMRAETTAAIPEDLSEEGRDALATTIAFFTSNADQYTAVDPAAEMASAPQKERWQYLNFASHGNEGDVAVAKLTWRKERIAAHLALHLQIAATQAPPVINDMPAAA